MKRSVLILFLSISILFVARAQILDDSTRQIYGTSTTFYFYEDDVLFDQSKDRRLDTALAGINHFHYIWSQNQYYQNLGNMGTAIMPVYPEINHQLGRQTGFDTYRMYSFDKDSIRYFDTKSAYTEINYAQGSRGEQLFDIAFSRNIKPNWNVGLRLQRLTSDQVLGRPVEREPLADNYAFHANMSYRSKRYDMLFNFRNFNQTNAMTGGIKPDSSDTKADLYDYELEEVWLNQVQVDDRSNNYHLYQSYRVSDTLGFKVFHIFDRFNQRNQYRDENLQTNIDFYPAINLDSTRTDHIIYYESFENKAGIAWNNKSINLSAYLRRRDFYIDRPYTSRQRFYFVEHYLGGQAKIDIDKDIFYEGMAEGSEEGNIYTNHRLKFYGLKAGMRFKRNVPDLLYQYYEGNHYQWDNSFKQDAWFETDISYHLDLKNFKFEPFAKYQFIENYLFLNENATPEQQNEGISNISAGFKWFLKIHRFYLSGKATYFTTSDAETIRAPEITGFGRLYYQNKVIQNKLRLQIGTEVIYRSDYYGNAFAPVTQQFYLQDNFQLESYAILNMFLNVEIRKVRVFLQYSNALQGVSSPGYFATPFYTGQPATFEFGFNWRFFDGK